jgi:hypothetical protein
MSQMAVTITCGECGSGIHVLPTKDAEKTQCEVCHTEAPLNFDDNHFEGILKDCPCCGRKDFYKQKDFNRKVGVVLFIIAAIASIWTYGLSLIALWLVDLLLFKRLPLIAICYKCQSIFRNVSNIEEIYDFNHEMNDRIIYSDHDFKGEQLDH